MTLIEASDRWEGRLGFVGVSGGGLWEVVRICVAKNRKG
jgi:hypothetical protein